MMKPFDGALLIAEPFMKDSSFMRSVVFICRYDSDGAFGFAINKKTGFIVEDLVPDMEGIRAEVYEGGPVSQDTLHYVHRVPALAEDDDEVIDGIYRGNNFEMLREALQDGSVKPDDVRFFLGYSGWDGGQLEDEMTTRSWIITDANRKIVFDTKTDNIWKEALVLAGPEYKIMTIFPRDPQLN